MTLFYPHYIINLTRELTGMVSVCQDSLCKSPPRGFAADHVGIVPIGRALQTASSFTKGSCGSNYLSSGFHHGDFWFLIVKLAKIIDQLHSLIPQNGWQHMRLQTVMEAELHSAHLGSSFIVGTPKCFLWLQTRVTNSFRMDLLGLAKYQPGSSLDRCSNPCSCLNLDTVSLQRCFSWDGICIYIYIIIYNIHNYSRTKMANH